MNLRRWLPGSERAETLLFGGTLVLLGLLGLWWASLLARTVAERDPAARAELALVVERAARDPELRAHPDVVIVPTDDAPDAAIPLANRPELSVAPNPERLAALDARRSRQRVMVLGESSLMVALLAVCAFMLHRLVVSRQAIQREMLLFTGQMSHEMKTPLAGIRALLETIAAGRVDASDLPELATLALTQVERQEHLVQTLLQAQRLRVAREPLARRTLPVAPLLEAFAQHRRELPAAVPLQVDVPDGVVAAADRDAVWTVLENLVDNARKCDATRVTLRGARDGDVVRVDVIDDGRGFEPERARDLFRAFHSAHTDGGARHGTGLGLFICRRLATAMGGGLDAHSDGPGRGATFRLTLPAEVR